MSSYESSDAHRWSTADTVAGFLATLSIFASAIGLVWHPMRLIPAAILVALIAARMSARNERVAFIAVIVGVVCWTVGMAIGRQLRTRSTERERARRRRAERRIRAAAARGLPEDPHAVPPEWRELFESGDSDLVASHPGLLRLLEKLERDNGANGQPQIAAPAAPASAPVAAEPAPSGIDETLLGAVAAAMALVKAHRMHGHLAARLDPLGSEPLGDPALDETRLIPALTPELQERIPATLLRVHVPGETLKEALPNLRAVYSGTMAYEIEHLSDHAERVAAAGDRVEPLPPTARPRGADRPARVARTGRGFEQYLRRAFLGQQFSLEGLDAMMPMLDESIELAADAGAHEVVIGMAHRGRLNVLVHTVGRSYESILREFEGERTIDAVVVNDEGGTGDVKYHLSATGTRKTASGEVTITLAPNPSHLEAVDPVVEVDARRADRPLRRRRHPRSVRRPADPDPRRRLLRARIVAETLNLSSLDGYTTGGTLHLIANNQVGFTTNPNEGRSTRYSSDLAKGFDIPIIHVNANDPRRRSRRCASRSPTGRSSVTTSSSTWSATAASATTSRTRRRTRSR